jgi:hypothetical protein
LPITSINPDCGTESGDCSRKKEKETVPASSLRIPRRKKSEVEDISLDSSLTSSDPNAVYF